MYNNARYKRDESREKRSKHKQEDMFRGPHLHTKGFPLCPHMTFHKGTSTEELQLQPWSTQLHSLSPLNKRKAQSLAQSKEKNTT